MGEKLINRIRQLSRRLKFTGHAKNEMLYEEFGEISEGEVKETLTSGEVLEEYKTDRPYPSYLINGKTKSGRPLHIVCAPVEEEELLIIITVYEPHPDLWIDFRKRRNRK